MWEDDRTESQLGWAFQSRAELSGCHLKCYMVLHAETSIIIKKNNFSYLWHIIRHSWLPAHVVAYLQQLCYSTVYLFTHTSPAFSPLKKKKKKKLLVLLAL